MRLASQDRERCPQFVGDFIGEPALVRQRIVDAAAWLMQAQGFHATGLNQIIQVSGTPKGSLYFHFPEGKEAIAIAAMEQSGRMLTVLLEQVLAVSPSLEAAVEFIWRHFMSELEASDYRKGCPIATLTLEAAGEFPGIQACGAAIYEQWQALFSRKLQAEGVAPAKATGKANALLALLEGALLLSRARRSIEPLQLSLATAKALI